MANYNYSAVSFYIEDDSTKHEAFLRALACLVVTTSYDIDKHFPELSISKTVSMYQEPVSEPEVTVTESQAFLNLMAQPIVETLYDKQPMAFYPHNACNLPADVPDSHIETLVTRDNGYIYVYIPVCEKHGAQKYIEDIISFLKVYDSGMNPANSNTSSFKQIALFNECPEYESWLTITPELIVKNNAYTA